jgi:DHA1 family inner membrane transport protein
VTGQQPAVDGLIPMADGTGVVEAACAEVTELKLGDHVARGETGLAAHVAAHVALQSLPLSSTSWSAIKP